MKRFLLTITAIAGLFSLSTAHALLGFSVGAHIGSMDFDNAAVSGDNIIGANLGYKIGGIVIADFAVDLEINQSLDDFNNSGTDASYDSTALFLTTKTAGPIYAIGRLGLVKADLGTQSDDGTAVAVGVGFSLGTQIEVTLKSISFDDLGDADQVNVRIGF